MDARNPPHDLRKEFGSIICNESGIFAASAQLRHSDIRITRNTYVDKRGRHTVPIGDFMPDEPSELEAVS